VPRKNTINDIQSKLDTKWGKNNYVCRTYTNLDVEALFYCTLHNEEFLCIPKNAFWGKNISPGCNKCNLKNKRQSHAFTTQEFIFQANKVHSNKYNYSDVVYINAHTKVKIGCEKHGPFFQLPNNHTSHKQGCPVCKCSKGETIIESWLSLNNIPYIRQKTFNGCVNKRQLKFDFYIPSHNLCIEFDGEQHSIVGKFTKHKDKAQQLFDYIQSNDRTKNDYCNQNNIGMLRIPYTEIRNIFKILDDHFNIFRNDL